MSANFVTAIPSGAAITFGLLFIMHSLIDLQPGIIDDSTPIKFTGWLHVPEKEVLVRDEWEIPNLPDVVHPPPTIIVDDFGDAGSGTSVIHVPVTEPVQDRIGFQLHMSDGPLIALVRVEPSYPSPLAQRGIEGYVVVRFDVYANGTVGNIGVVESSHSGFERSAVRAASRFRFKARIVDGQALITSGVQYRFRFEMKK